MPPFFVTTAVYVLRRILSVLIFYVPFFIHTSSLAGFISNSRSHRALTEEKFIFTQKKKLTKRIFVFIWLQTFVM